MSKRKSSFGEAKECKQTKLYSQCFQLGVLHSAHHLHIALYLPLRAHDAIRTEPRQPMRTSLADR